MRQKARQTRRAAPKAKVRKTYFRLDERTYRALLDAAHEEDEPVSRIVRRAIRDFLRAQVA